MELLIENGFDGFADVMRILINEAMTIEWDRALGAGPYERSEARKRMRTNKYAGTAT